MNTQTPGGDRFDPFLREVDGAEVTTDAGGVFRAIAALAGREVMVAGPDGSLTLAQVSQPWGLTFRAPCGLGLGQEVAITDHRGLRYLGVRAVVDGLLRQGRKTEVRLSLPSEAVFYPGRRHTRLEGALQSQIVVEFADELLPARGLNLSLGGVALAVSTLEQLAVDQPFTVHLKLEDETVSLPARVRSVDVQADETRLGVEFEAHSESLAARIRQALA